MHKYLKAEPATNSTRGRSVTRETLSLAIVCSPRAAVNLAFGGVAAAQNKVPGTGNRQPATDKQIIEL